MRHPKRYLAIILAALMFMNTLTAAAVEAPASADSQTVGSTDSATAAGAEGATEEGFSRYKYAEYIGSHADAKAGSTTFSINAKDYIAASDDVKVFAEYDAQLTDKQADSIYTGEESFVEWQVNVPETGLYNMNLLYYPVEGKGSDIERSLLIDGKQPFTEAGAISFQRIWQDIGEVKQDNAKNDMRREQQEVKGWISSDFSDSTGLTNDAFQFYLTAGVHTIRMESTREPVVINCIKIHPAEVLKSYKELKQEYDAQGYRSATQPVRTQAEDMALKSSGTIYAESERSSANMEPYSYDVIKLNYISGSKFSSPTQWVRWSFDVKEAGLYKIALRFKQSDRDGAFCSRLLKINGQVPCEEAKSIRFNYDSAWQVQALATPDGEVMEFYFDKGVQTIDLQVTLGEFATVASQVDDVVYRLNDCYRRILMITGSAPDAYRDYQFPNLIPEVIEEMAECSKDLKAIKEQIIALTGDVGSMTSVYDKLTVDIDMMSSRPQTIAKKLQNFKTNLGALGTWMLDITSQPVSLDWIELMPVEAEMPKAEKGFFSSAWHQIMLFAASFYMDYNNVGNTTPEGQANRKITAWIATGRDQSQIIRQLINNSFTNKDIEVELQLVAAGTLLPATLAGIGPDVSLQNAAAEPLNYAIRNAVLDLKQFDNYDEVAKQFNPEAIIPYTYLGKVYALPETFTFPMMFYRKDILAEMGMSIPQTWDEVYDCIVKLNMNQMMFGLQATIQSYATLLYQQGGTFYNSDGSASALDTQVGIKTFEQWTEFYTAYGTLVEFDFANRFRTGEMPIGIADYSMYNQLSVFAPEIRGLWEFAPLPGTYNKEGVIDRSTAATGTGSIILSSTKEPEAAWEFISWFNSTEIQVAFGRELESVMGVAARYTTANEAALAQLPWATSDYKALMAQWKWAKAVPECPGSYIMPRYVDFAFKAVANSGQAVMKTGNQDPGRVLTSYVKQINEELTRKRAEFGQ